MTSNIISARYAAPLPPGGYPADAAVIAVHATYGDQHRRANDDIDDGGMLAFLADGGVIGPYVAPPVDVAAVVAEAKRRVAARADQIADLITGTVPLAERFSWPTKETAARAVLAGAASPVQQAMLAAEAQVMGESVAELASHVVARVDTYIVAAGLISGQRRKTMAALDALTNPATLDADIAAIFANAETEAQALLVRLADGG